MFKNLLPLLLIQGIILGSTFSSHAQEFTGADAKKIVSGSSLVKKDPVNGNITFLRMEDTDFTSVNGQMQWLRTYILRGSTANEYKLIKEEKDQQGFFHFRFA